jgi:hypothetical protein
MLFNSGIVPRRSTPRLRRMRVLRPWRRQAMSWRCRSTREFDSLLPARSNAPGAGSQSSCGPQAVAVVMSHWFASVLLTRGGVLNFRFEKVRFTFLTVTSS